MKDDNNFVEKTLNSGPGAEQQQQRAVLGAMNSPGQYGTGTGGPSWERIELAVTHL